MAIGPTGGFMKKMFNPSKMGGSVKGIAAAGKGGGMLNRIRSSKKKVDIPKRSGIFGKVLHKFSGR